MPPIDRSEFLSRLRADQSSRWKRGERVRVEHYVSQHPDLAADTPLLLDLILAEMHLRAAAGDTPSLGEYLDRFPGQADVLRLHHGLDGFLRSLGGSTGPEAATSDVTALALTEAPPLADFEMLEELGRGGMGVVFKATQRGLDRTVAVKLIRTGPYAGAEEVGRFRTEARAVARLQHPGVVQVFALGEEAGSLFLVLEYMPGGSLAARLKQGLMPVREAAEVVRELAGAMAAAHAAQVIHRDLKPGNVLLDAAGRPKVSDFGLARLLDVASEYTGSEAIVGTPAYMAPEQARGKSREVDARTDVWALGAILYHALTGTPPFAGETNHETLEAVKHREPVAPRRRRAEVPADLEAVCLKCLEKEPERRYPSAAALADDLRLWLAGEPPRQPPGTLRRLAWALRRRARWVAAAVLLPLLMAIVYAVGKATAPPPAGPQVVQPEEPDREEELRKIQAALAREEAVVLVGKRGRPRWSEWVLNKATVFDGKDQAFKLETFAHSLLELVRDLPVDRFRLRARIRHEKSGVNAVVGLYVGRAPVPGANPQAQVFLRVTFNDLDDAEERTVNTFRAAGLPPPPLPILNDVSLKAVVHSGHPVRDLGARSAGCFSAKVFRPNKHGAARWRDLQVEVTPDRIQVWWEGDLVGDAARAVLAESLDAVWPAAVGQGQPPRFNPRGGVGLIVSDSVAAFEDVVLEPR